jgi:hypothetical protein
VPRLRLKFRLSAICAFGHFGPVHAPWSSFILFSSVMGLVKNSPRMAAMPSAALVDELEAVQDTRRRCLH